MLLFGIQFPASAQFFLPWEYTDIETDVRQSGANADMLIDDNGNFHISYWNISLDRLVYAHKNAGGTIWTFEFVDSTQFNGHYSSLAFDTSGKLFVAYFENQNSKNAIKIAERIGPNNWLIDQVQEITEFGFGLGDYGPWSELYNTERLRPRISLAINSQNVPRIAFFNGFYSANQITPCGGGEYYTNYELRLYHCYKDSTGWTMRSMGELPDKYNSCSSNPMPRGDRYGEFAHLLIDNNDRHKIVCNSYFNTDVRMYENTVADTGWIATVVDSGPAVMAGPGTGFYKFWTVDGLDAFKSKDGSFHFSWAMSIKYGFNFTPLAEWVQTPVYGRLDTNGNYFRYTFDPNTGSTTRKPYWNHTSVYAINTDSIFMCYADNEINQFILAESVDSGQTWKHDTIFETKSAHECIMKHHGDSLYVLVYDTDGDRLVMLQKELGDSVWIQTAITRSEQRGIHMDGAVRAVGADTLIYMAYDDVFQEKIFFREGTINNGITWKIDTLETGSTNIGEISMDVAPGGEIAVLFSSGAEQDLKLAIRSGSTWATEIVDTSAFAAYNDIFISPIDSTIHLVWHEDSSGNSFHGFRKMQENTWSIQYLDTTDSPTGEYLSLVAGSDNIPRAAYYHAKEMSLVHGWFDTAGSPWNREYIFRDSSTSNGRFNALTIAPDGQPAVAYANDINDRLYFSKRDAAGNWPRTALDSLSGDLIGQPCHLKYFSDGAAWILYGYSLGFDKLQLARGDSTGWDFLAVSSSGRLSRSLVFDFLGNDIYILGQKNQAGNTGLGMLHSPAALSVDIEELRAIAERPSILNFPNPFSNETIFKIDSPKPRRASLYVMNLHGKKVANIMDNEFIPEGESLVRFNAEKLPSGIYLYVLKGERFQQTGKMIIVH